MSTKDSRRIGDAEALHERNRALAAYARWDREHPVAVDPARALAAVAALYRLLPPDARRREDDPEFEGVRRMLDALARLGRSRG